MAASRNLLILGPLFGLATAGVLFSGVLDPIATPPEPDPGQPAEASLPDASSGPVEAIYSSKDHGPPARNLQAEAALIRDGKGIISGSVGVSARIAPKLKHFKIVVQEVRNTNRPKARALDKDGKPLPPPPKPFVKVYDFEADLSLGTPYFDLDHVPFSRHPYRVSVTAPGIDGSFALVHVNADHPRGSREVRLQLTEGTVYSVRVLDQKRLPRGDLDVRLIPVGQGVNYREVKTGLTNNAGSVVFENVAHGTYEIHVGMPGALMADPKPVRIVAMKDVAFSNGRLRTQGNTIIVPDGLEVRFEVLSRYGYAVRDGEVRIQQLEVKRLYEYKGKTDVSGLYTAPHLPYGIYQIDVKSQEFGNATSRFKIEKNKPAPRVSVTTSR